MLKNIPYNLPLMTTKRLLFILLCINASLVQAQIQVNTPWVWVKGDSLINGQYNYGTKGVPSVNNVPRARNKATYWTDKDGNFWLFSGNGLTDLWKYNPLSNEWTWVHGDSTTNNPDNYNYGVKGVSAPGNLPRGRYQGVGWTDKDGNLWLFGGSKDGNDYGMSQILNDLWKYNIATNEWTWMKGDSITYAVGVEGTIGQPSPNNTPSGRRGSSKWTDAAGNFWLFGGYGKNSDEQLTYLNDMWKYEVATNSWTLVIAYSYDPTNTNKPHGRYKAASWIDQEGKLWLFGGISNELTSRPYYLQDTWRYDPLLNQWSLKQGSPAPTSSWGSIPGAPGAVAPAGPGSPVGRVTWVDGNNDLWLFGGTGGGDYENYLWKYNITANAWTFMKGNTVFAEKQGVYGVQGVADINNRPGKRAFSAAWQDRLGNFYLFGGQGYDAKAQQLGSLNDMWKIASNLPTSVPEEPGAGAGIYLFTGSNYTTLHIRGLKPERNWQSLEIISFNGSRISINNGLAGKTQFDCTIDHLQAGTYTTVIRNKKGERAVMKFIKL